MTFEHVVLAVFAVFLLCGLWGFYGLYIQWQRAWLAGVQVRFTHLLAMRLRQVPEKLILDNAVKLAAAKAPVAVEQLEAHFLAGGRVAACADAYLAARAAGLPAEWHEICALDLLGKLSGENVAKGLRQVLMEDRR